MPPKFKFTREEIIQTALDLTRKNGIGAVTARGLGTALGSSPQPVFGLFQNMEEVQREVLNASETLYQHYLQKEIAVGKMPPYKASGMAYIRFAEEEKELFKLLFMRDRSAESTEENRDSIRPQLEMIQKNTGLSEDDAYVFHLEMWVCVHGIAAMIATNYLAWDADFVSGVLSDLYLGLQSHWCLGRKEHGSN